MLDFIKDVVYLHYGMETLEISKMTVGAGSNTYLLVTNSGKYIFKNANIKRIYCNYGL